jgi:hypothetical protein
MTEDYCADETYISVDGQKVWGPHSMNNMHTYHIFESVPMAAGSSSQIKLMDQDAGWWDPDDNLGTHVASIEPGEQVALYRSNSFCYLLFYIVENEGEPAKLEIVSPSLGHPQIRNFADFSTKPIDAKIATRSVCGDIDKAVEELALSVWIEDAETGQKWSCVTAVKDSAQIRENLQKYRSLRDQLNGHQAQFPTSNDQFKAGCGIVTDFDVQIVPIWAAGPSPNPAGRFNLHLGDSVARNCLFLSETWSNEDELYFLHVTDPHVAVRNDMIARGIEKEHPYLSAEQRALLREAYRNPNEHLRKIIRHANEQHVDFITITGDLVLAYTDSWHQWPAWKDSNVRCFEDIITGQDGIGEPLRCPLFVVPGNHEFLSFSAPLRYNVAGLDKATFYGELEATGLGNEKHHVYADWMAQQYSIFQFWGDLPATKAYSLIEPAYPLLAQYLVEISFDLSFRVEVGQHRLVMINTAQDVKVPGYNLSGIMEFLERTSDFTQDGTHNAGFSLEDLTVLEHALKNPPPGMVLAFTHAPIINLHKHCAIGQAITEDYQEHAAPPPNEATDFLYALLPFLAEHIDSEGNRYMEEPTPSEKAAKYLGDGFPQAGVRYFKKGRRDDIIDFACIEGHPQEVLDLLANPQWAGKAAAVFSGHTHKIHEFRVSRSQEPGTIGFWFYADNYSGSVGGEWLSVRESVARLGKQPPPPIHIPSDVPMHSRSLKETLVTWSPENSHLSWTRLPVGSTTDALPFHRSDAAVWLKGHSPLLLTSGTLKGRDKPQFREVHLTGTGDAAAILSMRMVSLD